MIAKRLLAAVAALLLVSAAACSRGRTDAQIAGDVVTRIGADARVSNKQIAVTSTNGIVTLSGSAPSEAERAAAANDAAQVRGVKTVVNNLVTVATPAAPPQQARVEEPKPAEPPASARPRKPSASHPKPHASIASISSPATSVPAVPAANANLTAAATAVSSVSRPPDPPKPVTIASGTTMSIRMIDSIDSGRNHPGDMFHASLYAPITVDDKTIIPEGADVTGRVVDARAAGHFAGQPELALELVALSVNGRRYSLSTNQYTQREASRGARTAKTVGSGAAIGAIIGAIAGGGKGAAIGAAAGAGVGGGVQAASKPQQVHIAPEALLSFRLESPLTVTPVATLEHNQTESSRSAPPEPNNIIDYSDTPDTDRPVLKRRQPGNSPDSPK